MQMIQPFLKTIESLEAKHPEMNIQAEPPKMECKVSINPKFAHAIKMSENGDFTIDIFGPPSSRWKVIVHLPYLLVCRFWIANACDWKKIPKLL